MNYKLITDNIIKQCSKSNILQKIIQYGGHNINITIHFMSKEYKIQVDIFDTIDSIIVKIYNEIQRFENINLKFYINNINPENIIYDSDVYINLNISIIDLIIEDLKNKSKFSDKSIIKKLEEIKLKKNSQVKSFKSVESVELSDISILQYNILAPQLAIKMLQDAKTPDGNFIYNAEDMEPEIRLRKIISYIEKAIKTSTSKYLIICLQEVCDIWRDRLIDFFTFYNYEVKFSRDGYEGNSFMGVLLAFPNKLKSKIYYYKVCQEQNIGPELYKFEHIVKRNNNTAIIALLEDTDTGFKFGVITYHMPRIMPNKHKFSFHESNIIADGISNELAKMLYTKINEIMGRNYWIYAGDFNIVPDSQTCKYLEASANSIWKNCVGKYPFTNNGIVQNNQFQACLDYMFYSRNLRCKNVIYTEALKIIPNNKEASDHIPIIANFNTI